MEEKATGSAGKIDEKKEGKASARYTHKSNTKPAGESGKMAEGGESSNPKSAATESAGGGGSPIGGLHARHEAAHAAMDSKHAGERTALHKEHEANLAKHGHRPDVHATHHEQRTRQHRHHSDERRALHDQHTMDHLQAAGIHGGQGLAEAGGAPAAANAGVGAAAGPTGAPPVQTAQGQPQPPMPGAPAAAMA